MNFFKPKEEIIKISLLDLPKQAGSLWRILSRCLVEVWPLASLSPKHLACGGPLMSSSLIPAIHHSVPPKRTSAFSSLRPPALPSVSACTSSKPASGCTCCEVAAFPRRAQRPCRAAWSRFSSDSSQQHYPLRRTTPGPLISARHVCRRSSFQMQLRWGVASYRDRPAAGRRRRCIFY